MLLVIVVVLVHFAVGGYLYSRDHPVAAAIVVAAGILELFFGYRKYR